MKKLKRNLPIFLSLFISIMFMPNIASAWWNCPSGYKLQLNSNKTKVRCYRASKTYTRSLKSCPRVKVLGQWVGSFYKKDYFRNKGDACTSKDPLGVVTIAVPHSFCSSGYKQKKRAGRDKCIKKIRSKEVYPNRNVR